MNHFLTSESGAVTVDWVVLTAGLVGLGLATMAVVSTGVQDAATDVQEQLEAHHIINAHFNVAPEVGNLIMVADGVETNLCSAMAFLETPPPDTVVSSCNIQQASAGYTYEMSDGTQWTKAITHNGGQPYRTETLADGTTRTIGLNSEWETTWYDGDGNVVADPEG